MTSIYASMTYYTSRYTFFSVFGNHFVFIELGVKGWGTVVKPSGGGKQHVHECKITASRRRGR